VLNWHTGDFSNDPIYPNENKCQKLEYVRSLAYSSPEWISYNTSHHIQTLTANLTKVFGAGYWTWYNSLDCIMTTVCSDRHLPDNDHVMTDALLNDTLTHVEKTFAYLALYNNSYWSKLAMYGFAKEIQSN